MTEYLRQELRKAIQGNIPKPLIVCGAGVTIQATARRAPNWPDLIASGIRRVADLDSGAASWATNSLAQMATATAKSLIAIADELTDRLGGAGNAEFKTWLKDTIGDLVMANDDLIRAIVGLGCPIATTNYDDILSAVTGLPPIVWSDHVSTLEFLNGQKRGILHLHGHWQVPQSVVLGSKSYETHSEDERRKLLQSFAALNRPTLFIGCSDEGLADPDFSAFDEFVAAWKEVAERRYWLVRQEVDRAGVPKPLPAPGLDRRLFPVAFGSEHDDLTAFVWGLAPSSSIVDQDENLRCIDQYEPRPHIFGRDDEVCKVVAAVLGSKSAIVAGGPGMGKTAIATTALYDDQVVKKFGRRRVFVSLESDSEPRALLVRLVDALGFPTVGDDPSLLRLIERCVATIPLVAIIDNAETIFDVDRAESERLLNLAAQLSGLALVVTMRGTPPVLPRATVIDDLGKLSEASSLEMFSAIAGGEFVNDVSMRPLLHALDGHALSIHLVAAQALGLSSLAGLHASWEEERAAILARPGEMETRLTSVRASLAVTLNGPRMRNNPRARRLLAILGHLPGGLADTDVRKALGDKTSVSANEANKAIFCLRQVRLLEAKLNRRLRVLTPLRECIKTDVSFHTSDRNRLCNNYLKLAVKANQVGSEAWESVRGDVEREADNLDAVCELGLEHVANHDLLFRAIGGVKEYKKFTGGGSIRCLEKGVRIFRGLSLRSYSATIHRWLGEIALQSGDKERATKYFEDALKAFQQMKDIQGEVNTLVELGEVARHRGDPDAAKSYYNNAVTLSRQIRDQHGEGNAFIGMANIAISNGDNSIALEHLERASTLFRKNGNVVGEANAKGCFGDVALGRSDLPLAAEYFEEALQLCRRIGDWVGLANNARSLGYVALCRSQYELAEAKFEDAINSCRRLGHILGEARGIEGMGSLASRRGDYATAKSCFQEAELLFRRIDSQSDIANTILLRAELAKREGNNIAAYSLFEDALQFDLGLAGVDAEATALLHMGFINRCLGRAGEDQISRGFAKLFDRTDGKDLALPGWRLLERMLTSDDAVEIRLLSQDIRTSWLNIGRGDLVAEWID